MAQVRADRVFRHAQLPDPRAIRILVLEPTIDPSSEIKCSLYFTSLDDPLEFEALSYSWDSQTLSHPILCRQLFAGPDVYFALNVTYNCLAALKQFRLSDLPRPLWIDSICIDQTNVEERNQQVSLMGELYPSARHVIVWLGEKDEATEQAMKFITNFGDGLISLDKSVEKRKDEVFALLHERLVNIKSTPDGELSDKLQPLFQRSWFHRMWTVQEVTTPPPQDITMYCGDASMLFLHLYLFVHLAVKKFYFTCNKIRDAMELQEIILDSRVEVHMDYDKTDGVTEDPLSSLTVFNFAQVLKAKIPSKGTNAKITPILSRARFKHSTDAKDKIFALLGVFDYLGVQMPPPDYHKPIEVVYTEATVSTITFDKSLGILLQCPSEKRNPHLPSWVPDFRLPGFLVDDPRDPSDDAESFKASPNLIPQWRFSGENKLTVRGKIVDIVEIRLPSFSPSLFFSGLKDFDSEAFGPTAPGLPVGPERLREMHEMFEVLTSWVQSCADQTTYPNDEPIQTALYRTLLNDLEVVNKLARKDNAFATWHRIMMANERDRLQMTIDSQDRRRLKDYNARIDKSSRPAFLKNLRKWTHSSFDAAISTVHRKSILDEVIGKIDPHQISGGAILELGVFSLNACICSQSRKKAFYVTQKKYFGTAPDRISVSIEKDDRIAILASLNVPVVLRPRPDGTYAFVSHCYLHGFMQGEAFTGDTDELQDIVLV